MEFREDGLLLGKLKTTISVVYAIFIWVVKLSSTIKVPPHHYLSALISPKSQLVSHKACEKIHLDDDISQSLLLSSPPPSPSSLALSSTGDLIGSESGVYMSSTKDVTLGESEPYSCYLKMKNPNQENAKKRDFPPPISSLVNKENLACCTPWEFSRSYVDGRLIVKEKRVERYEYFETFRENGRLVMNLVPLKNNFECCDLDEDNVSIEDAYRFDSDIEQEEEYDEDYEMGHEIKQIGSFNMFESSEDKRSIEEKEMFMSKPSFFDVPISVNKPILV